MKKTRIKEKTTSKKIIIKTREQSEEESDEEILLENMKETRDRISNKHKDYWNNVIKNEITEFNIYKNYCIDETVKKKNIEVSDNVDDDLKVIHKLSEIQEK